MAWQGTTHPDQLVALGLVSAHRGPAPSRCPGGRGGVYSSGRSQEGGRGCLLVVVAMGACLCLAPPSGEESRAGGRRAGGVGTVRGGDGATGTGSEHLDASAARRCHLLDVLQQLVQRRNVHRLGGQGERLKGAGPRTDFICFSASPPHCATCHPVGKDTRGGGASTHHCHKAQKGSRRGWGYSGRRRSFSSRR